MMSFDRATPTAEARKVEKTRRVGVHLPVFPTATVAGVAFSNVTMAEAISSIFLMVQKRDCARHIVTGNLDHLFMLQRVKHTSNRAFSQAPLRERVAGSDLFWELARASHATGLRLFFLGGQPGAAVAAAEEVRRRYPKSRICGTHCPPQETFASAGAQDEIAAAIRRAAPDVLPLDAKQG